MTADEPVDRPEDRDDVDDRAIDELVDALGLRQVASSTGSSRPVVPTPRSGSPTAVGKQAALDLVSALRRRREHAVVDDEGSLPGFASAIHRLRILGRPDEMLRAACDEAAAVTGFDRITLSAVDPDGLLRLLHTSGGRAGGRRGLLAPATDEAGVARPGTPEATALETGAPVVVDEPTDGRPGSGEAGPRAVVPVLRSGTVVGLFHAVHEPPRPPAPHRVSGLAAFAAVFASVWHGSALEARWEDRMATVADAVATTVTHAPVERGEEFALDPDGGATGDEERGPAHGDGARAPATSPLTPRERVVLDHVLAGAANREIADTLVLTVETVKTHVKNILRKLGAANRAELISRSYRGPTP